MLKKAIFAFLFVSLAMTLPGCFHKIEVVEIEKFSNVELGFNGMKSDLVVRVYNPNYLSFKLKSADILLSVGEIEAGDVELAEQITLASNDTTEVVLSVATRKGALSRILKQNFRDMINGVEIPFSAEGKITGQSLGFKREIPIKYSETLEL